MADKQQIIEKIYKTLSHEHSESLCQKEIKRYLDSFESSVRAEEREKTLLDVKAVCAAYDEYYGEYPESSFEGEAIVEYIDLLLSPQEKKEECKCKILEGYTYTAKDCPIHCKSK